MSQISKILTDIRQQIDEAARAAGRLPDQVKLLAVSKTKPAEQVQAAVDAGQHLFGENYVQAAEETFSQIKALDKPVELHMIGALQRNKVKRAVDLFDVIQTVDRASLVKEIDKQAGILGLQQRVLVQVNISEEDSKSGCLPDATATLCDTVLQCEHVRLEGLMSIGTWLPAGSDDSVQRKEFRAMRMLRDSLVKELGVDLPELSMGMSSDFRIAIEEGATIVRVGSAIFGERN